MKKFILIIIALLLTGCDSKGVLDTSPTPNVTETPVEETKEYVNEESFNIGFGFVNSNSTMNADGNKEGEITFDTTYCVVLIDDNNIIRAIKFDDLSTNGSFNNQGVFTWPKEGNEVLTKIEQKNNYGLQAISSIKKEYYDQVSSFEQYCIGKTVLEVMQSTTLKEDLVTSCTISVDEFIKSLEAASKNTRKASNVHSFSMASNTTFTISNTSLDNDGELTYFTNFVAIAFDANDNIVYEYIDSIDNGITVSSEGTITNNDGLKDTRSKKELKNEYGLKEASSIDAEWFTQVEAFEKSNLNLNLLSVITNTLDENNKIVDEDLSTKCTIDVKPYLELIDKASANKYSIQILKENNQ